MIRDPVSHEHVLAVTAQNPQRKGENAMVYVQRLAVLSGLIRPEDTAGEPPVGGWSSAGEAMAAPETPTAPEPPTGEEYWNR